MVKDLSPFTSCLLPTHVEAGGVEPPSEKLIKIPSTSLVDFNFFTANLTNQQDS